MLDAFRKIYGDDGLRTATIALVVMGIAAAATFPYLSIIGITELGLSTQAFGAIMLLSALISTSSTVVIGYFSDHAANRKTMIMFSFIAGVIGFGQLSIWPSQATFTLYMLFFVPLTGAGYSQLFAVIRSIAQQWGNEEAASINTAIRAAFASSWIIVPGLAGLFIAWPEQVSHSFIIATVVSVVCMFYYWAKGSNQGKKEGGDEAVKQTASAGLKQAFKLIGSNAILSRVVSLAVIGITHPVNAAVMPLIVLSLEGGSVRDVGLLAGLVAGLEIPLMLLGGAMVRRYSLVKVIVFGGLCHVVYLVALAFVPSIGYIYALCVINAAGAAILLTLHLNYLQDTMPNRPGLGTSLMSIQGLIQRGMGAGIVAGIGLLFGLSGALIISAIACLIGIGLLFWAEKQPIQLEAK
jgi:predicted MFS family arabinose efflux permease